MLGWEVGTFEFLSDRIIALGVSGGSRFSNTKLKLRTGGSVGKIPRSSCHKFPEKDGVYWDIRSVIEMHKAFTKTTLMNW